MFFFGSKSISARFFTHHIYMHEQSIQYIQNKNINIKIKGDIQDLLGINIDSRQEGSTHLTQTHLIDQILEYIKMGETVNPK